MGFKFNPFSGTFDIDNVGTGGGGSGDVVGPASATDSAIALYDTTTGKLIKNSVVIVDGSGNMTGIGNITLSGTVDGVDVSAFSSAYNSHAADSTIHFTQGAIAIAASQVTSGTFADARIAASNVTQHVGAINHNLLLNYVADEHIAHSGVSINTAANSGLAGGGTIAASRSLTVDVNNLSVVTPVLADSIPFYDASGAVTGKNTFTVVNGILTFAALSDVTITSASNGQTLRYDSAASEWINNSIIRNTGTVEINPTAVASNQPYSFLIDHAATNLVNNPSFELSITDFWTSTGTPTLTNDATTAFIGTACLKMVTSTANSGIISASIPVSINTNYVFSFYVKGNSGGESVYATVTGNSSGAVNSISGFFPTAGIQNAVNTMWSRYTFGMTTNGSDTSVTLQIRSELATANQIVFIDAVQFEAKSLPSDANEVVFASSYLDGSMGVGYAWSGTAHNSTSTRTAGSKFLAPLSTTANRGNLVLRTDGSIARLFADAEEIQHGTVAGTRNEPNFPFTFLGDIKTNVNTSGILAGVMNVRNTANGTALHVQSQATTSEGFIVSADSVTSGSCMSVFGPADLAIMASNQGKFFTFSGKEQNADMYSFYVDKVTMGALKYQFQKNVNILGGGSQNSTSRAIGTTVSVTNAIATVTGTNFLTDFKRGQHIQINNGGVNTLSYTIFSIESNTSLTLSGNWTGTTNAARAVTSRVLQYSPPLIALEGSYANHGNTLNTADFMYSLYASGGAGQFHVFRSAARGTVVTPTADHIGHGLVTARQVSVNSGLIFGTDAEAIMISGYTILANELAPGGCFRISFVGSAIMDNLVRTLTWRVKLGATPVTILTSTAVQVGVVGTVNFRGVIEIYTPTTTTQICSLSIVGKDGASLLPGLTYSVSNLTTTGTVDMRLDQALTVTCDPDAVGQVITVSGVTTEIL